MADSSGDIVLWTADQHLAESLGYAERNRPEWALLHATYAQILLGQESYYDENPTLSKLLAPR